MVNMKVFLVLLSFIFVSTAVTDFEEWNNFKMKVFLVLLSFIFVSTAVTDFEEWNNFKMKVFLVLRSFIFVSTAVTDFEEWNNFKIQHDKSYISRLEENFRYTIFKKNIQKVRAHNEKFRKGESTFTMGINKFADMTGEEFQELLGLQRKTKPAFNKEYYFVPNMDQSVPDFLNWTAAGAVTNVKDQGRCGSCWSFSAVGSIEGQYFRSTRKLVSLSAQNLVDCTTNCAGCHGGFMDHALKYVESKGIYTEKDYPYRGIEEPCLANTSSVFLKISSYNYVKANQEEDLKEAVATIGPITVGIEATDAFQLYNSGILNDTTCGNDEFDLNHGVLVVGYGTENGIDYWIVKNSWGGNWGERGFVRMLRNAKNQCGIATEPVYPIL